MTELVILGDEAWTAEEWAARQRRLARQRTPERREQRRLYFARWRDANRDRFRQLKRESAYRTRAHPTGSLHDLACTGTTRRTGCECRKIVCYDRAVG